MIKCVSNKRVYQTRELAEDALIDSHSQFEHKGGGPVGVYQCEDCGYFHLTSKGPMNQRLTDLLKKGKLGRAREANHWLNKLRKK